MSIVDYNKALKSGQRNYRQLISQGHYANLPVLDEILADSSNIKGEMNLGVSEIPIDLIVGTKTAGRRNSFASNFMPLLGVDTEFAAKWISLSDILLEEGLRDPIVVYEYINHYYVMEGNKRVSVMKYLGAATIPGKVTRIVPRQTEEKENKIYYEYMRFYEKTSINYLYFSKEGSFAKLLEHLGIDKEHFWSEEERIDFRSIYVNFVNAVKMNKEEEQTSFTNGDAFLAYLSIYNYEDLKNKTMADIQKDLSIAWNEIEGAAKNNSIELRMDLPSDTPSSTQHFFHILRQETPKAIKAAFIYDKTAETSSWTYNHELGRCYLEQVFSGQIKTVYYDSVFKEEALLESLADAVEIGCNMIFVTTPRHLEASLKFALEHPQVKILNCSLNTSHPIIPTYYGRFYEAKFLLGAIAASLCPIDTIGYIADYPIYGMTANINAFALGAKLINPRVKVHLKWSTLKDQEKSSIEQLKGLGISFICGPDLITPNSPSRQFGLFKANEDGEENLAMPVCDWGKLYEAIIRSVMKGTWRPEEDMKNKKAVNYWVGMSGGVIDVITSKALPIGTTRLVKLLRQTITNGQFHPFGGILYSQNHIIQQNENHIPSPEELMTIDWLCDNIVGSIPSLEDLKEEAQDIVKKIGIKKQI